MGLLLHSPVDQSVVDVKRLAVYVSSSPEHILTPRIKAKEQKAGAPKAGAPKAEAPKAGTPGEDMALW